MARAGVRRVSPVAGEGLLWWLPKVSLRSVTPGHCGLVPIAIERPIHFTASVVTSSTAPLSRASEAVRELLVSFFDLHLRKTASSCAEWSNLRVVPVSAMMSWFRPPLARRYCKQGFGERQA
jgi:hypothetical protein